MVALLIPYHQGHELVATEAQIVHGYATQKMNNAENSKGVTKTKAQLQAKVTSLQQELVSVKKAAERAQGQWAEHYPSSFLLGWIRRGAKKGF